MRLALFLLAKVGNKARNWSARAGKALCLDLTPQTQCVVISLRPPFTEIWLKGVECVGLARMPSALRTGRQAEIAFDGMPMDAQRSCNRQSAQPLRRQGMNCVIPASNTLLHVSARLLTFSARWRRCQGVGQSSCDGQAFDDCRMAPHDALEEFPQILDEVKPVSNLHRVGRAFARPDGIVPSAVAAWMISTPG